MTSFVILLANGNLWKNLGAADPAVFCRWENAESTVAGFSGRGALANPVIAEIVAPSTTGARKHGGYWIAG